MMNVGNPEEAFRLSFIPNDGVGLAREEFIIIHVYQDSSDGLLHFDELDDPAVRAEIDRLTSGYDDKPQYFVDKLAQGVAMIGAAFYPKDGDRAAERLQDQRVRQFDWRRALRADRGKPDAGVSRRLAVLRSRDIVTAFALECRAMKKVRDEMGLYNVKLMVPFCRTVDEGRRVMAEMEKHGLKRGENGLEVYVMCEIPSNVILADEFAEVFDGFSIGSNDLTQLVLGVDRDSEIVAHIFDERNAGREEDDRQRDPGGKGQGQEDRDLRPGAQRLPRVRPLSG